MSEVKTIVDDPAVENGDSNQDKAKSPVFTLTYATIGLALVMVTGIAAALFALGYTGDYLMNAFYESLVNPIDSEVQIG